MGTKILCLFNLIRWNQSMDFLICENIRDKGWDPLSYRINFNTYSVNRKLLCFTEILA